MWAPYVFLTKSAGLLDPMGLAWALMDLLQAACGLRSAFTTDHMGVSKPVCHPH